MKRFLFANLLLSLVFLSACSSMPLLKEPTATVKDLEVSELTMEGGTLQILCEVENPNGVDLTIDSLQYTLTLNKKQITSNEVSEKTNLPAKAKTVVKLPFKFKYTDIFSGISEILTQKSVAYSINGDAKLGIFKIPFSKQGDLALKK